MRIKLIFLLVVCYLSKMTAQEINQDFVGFYTDKKGWKASDILTLREDGTFEFTTLDPELEEVKQYYNEGIWTSKGNEVFLNPDKKPRPKTLTLKSESIDSLNLDSIIIKINYILEEYRNEEFQKERPFNFDSVFFIFDGLPKPFFAERNPSKSKFITIQSDNTIRISRKDLKMNQLTRITVDFDGRIKHLIEFNKTTSNYFVLEFRHPLDLERTPRNRKIIIKGKKAFIHNYNGQIDISLLGMGLKKRR